MTIIILATSRVNAISILASRYPSHRNLITYLVAATVNRWFIRLLLLINVALVLLVTASRGTHCGSCNLFSQINRLQSMLMTLSFLTMSSSHAHDDLG